MEKEVYYRKEDIIRRCSGEKRQWKVKNGTGKTKIRTANKKTNIKEKADAVYRYILDRYEIILSGISRKQAPADSHLPG